MPKEPIIEAMFNDIAPRYDFLNHYLSFGIDRIWRRRLIKKVIKSNPDKVVDVATGTGDLAITLAKKNKLVSVSGIDIAQKMLDIASEKLEKYQLERRIKLIRASSLNLPFPNDFFDAAMVAFGVRNFENPLDGLKEMLRVVKPGGGVFVLEFTTPRYWPIRSIYRYYFNSILPWVGKIVSKNKKAYSYLPESVKDFKERNDFLHLLMDAGFVNAQYSIQSCGIAAIYSAEKPNKI